MNRKYESKVKASGSTTTHYVKQTKDAFESRPTNTGFQSFLKWFRKNERERLAKNHILNQNKTINENGYLHVTIENRPTGSSNLLNTGTTSSSSSCDSVFSTATNSFSFIPPNQYRPFGDLLQPEKLIVAGPDTDTYCNRLKAHRNAREKDRQLELTLRKKYNIFDSDTLTSINSNKYNHQIHPQYTDRSLPQTPGLTQSLTESSIIDPSKTTNSIRRKLSHHRRTVSDSSKDKKAGAYVHVKGKRKAPKPPITEYSLNSSTLKTTGTLSPLSTLGRKKRRAPQPPQPQSLATSLLQSSVSEEVPTVLENGLFDDDEIKAIIGISSSHQLPQSVAALICNHSKSSSNSNRSSNRSSCAVASEESAAKMNDKKPIAEQYPCTDTLRLERGVLKSNLETTKSTTNNPSKMDEKSPSQLSPSSSSSISPRPWYKRSPAANKDYAIPFKKEVILKTMEKRKHKQQNKMELDSPQLPEVGFCRNSSLFDGFFARLAANNEKSDEVAEKRKSGIMMPNISELDREAAEIVSKEQKSEQAKIKSEEENFFIKLNKSENTVDLTENPTIATDDVKTKRTSTKYLISKFEKSNPTVGDTCLEKTNRLSLGSEQTNLKYKLEQTSRQCSMVHSIFNNVTKQTQVKETGEFLDKPKMQLLSTSSQQQEQKVTNSKTAWSCPYCTLENPQWRLVCEVCERFKPLDRKYFGMNETSRQSPGKSVNSKGVIAQLRESEKPTKDQKFDWETKAEKVMKYFRPKSAINTLTKSASETSVGRSSPFSKKRNSPSRLMDSPKLSMKSKLIDHLSNAREAVSSQNKNDQQISDKKEELIDSCAVVTTVTPVLIGPHPKTHDTESISTSSTTTSNTLSTIEEIRQARLARFSNLSKANEENVQYLNNNSNTRSTENLATSKLATLDDANALEKEKERLRDVIRAMNARALAEKYPVLQKSISLNDENTVTTLPEQKSHDIQPSRNILSLDLNENVSKNNSTKLGAIKKVFTKRDKIINTDKEIADNTNYTNNISDKDRIITKVSSFAQTSGLNKPIKSADIIQLPSPIQELNEDIKTPTVVTPTTSNYYASFKEDISSINIFDNYLDDTAGHIDNDLKQLEVISQQLNTQKGLEDFKATLKYSNRKISNTNTLALNKILKNLETAIADGEHELAARLAMDLAKMKVSLSVTKQRVSPDIIAVSKVNKLMAIVDIYVEDNKIRKGPIQLSLSPLISIADLKQKISNDFEIPLNTQQWTINNRLVCNDKDILQDFGVQDRTIMHLFLKQPKLTDPMIIGDEKELNTSKVNSKTKASEFNQETFGAQSLFTCTKSLVNEVNESNFQLNWTCPLCTLINASTRSDCVACSEKRPANHLHLTNEYKFKNKEDFELPIELKNFLRDDNDDDDVNDKLAKIRRNSEKGNDLNKVTVNRKSADMFNITIQPKMKIDLQKLELPKLSQSNLELSKTTEMINQPLNIKPIYQKSIVMTAITTSPNITKNKYRGVDNYNPHVNKNVELTKSLSKTSIDNDNAHTENIKIPSATNVIDNIPLNQQEITVSTVTTEEALTFQQLSIDSKTDKNSTNIEPHSSIENNQIKNPAPIKANDTSKNHYAELLNLVNSDTIPNTEIFDCPICFSKCLPKVGVILKDCLHTFCRECIVNTIKYSEDAEIKCPYMDKDYSCDSILSDREIKALVTVEEYEQHLAVSLRVAEHRSENAFHCKTPNCRGWCIYEDNVNQFKCPICQVVNCLTCRVIHDGLNCKQYQDRMSNDCDSSPEARRTKDMLADMIDKGDAMNCPTCQVVLMKKWGCDWLKCSMCKTEICWVTRGVRWGPDGKGDTSAGCKCGVNGVKCHPKCNYCH